VVWCEQCNSAAVQRPRRPGKRQRTPGKLLEECDLVDVLRRDVGTEGLGYFTYWAIFRGRKLIVCSRNAKTSSEPVSSSCRKVVVPAWYRTTAIEVNISQYPTAPPPSWLTSLNTRQRYWSRRAYRGAIWTRPTRPKSAPAAKGRRPASFLAAPDPFGCFRGSAGLLWILPPGHWTPLDSVRRSTGPLWIVSAGVLNPFGFSRRSTGLLWIASAGALDSFGYFRRGAGPLWIPSAGALDPFGFFPPGYRTLLDSFRWSARPHWILPREHGAPLELFRRGAGPRWILSLGHLEYILSIIIIFPFSD